MSYLWVGEHTHGAQGTSAVEGNWDSRMLQSMHSIPEPSPLPQKTALFRDTLA